MKILFLITILFSSPCFAEEFAVKNQCYQDCISTGLLSAELWHYGSSVMEECDDDTVVIVDIKETKTKIILKTKKVEY